MTHFSKLFLIGFFLVAAPAVDALEYATIERGGKTYLVSGQYVARTKDKGVVIMARDGVLWTLEKDEIKKYQRDKKKFEPFGRAQVIKQLQGELPKGFGFHNTANYVIAYNTTKPYAQWCGALYERLYGGFNNYWKRRGVNLHAPAWPMVAIIFDDKESYMQYARQELGDAASSIDGYYSIRTNRMATYDLTGADGIRSKGKRPSTQEKVNNILAQPGASPMVATLIHESSHQLSYNTGLQRRYIDNPLWVSEGIAVFFETPDLTNRKGWKTIGALNKNRLTQFRKYLPDRNASSLTSLITSDKRMRDTKRARQAYAESWALTYFLLKTKPKEFTQYLADLRTRKPLEYDTPTERLERFRKFFGDTKKLDAEFVRFTEKLGTRGRAT